MIILKKACFFLAAVAIFGTRLLLAAEPVELPMTVAATGKILVDIKVNGRPVTCIVDTGSPYFLLIDQVLVDQMGLKKIPVQARLRFFAEDQGGDTFGVVFDKVQIGPFEYDQVEGLTIDDIYRATGVGYQRLPNFWAQGILGMAFLEKFHVVIDYPHNHFLLYPSANSQVSSFASDLLPVQSVSDGRNVVPFLTDTGSTFSVASEKAMQPLGLSYSFVSGKDPLFKGMAKANELFVGGVSFRDITLEVADNFERYAGGNSFQGIIGYDYLKDLILDLDFPNKKISFERP